MTDNRGTDAAGIPPESEDMVKAPESAPAQAGDPLAEAQRQATDFKDKLLRALAEMENLRRRTERDVADARSYGITSFARDVLGVADNMRRALEASGSDVRKNADPQVIALLEGVELTERELLKVLEKNGVRKIEPLGEKFDPNVHQAMYEVPDASRPSGTIAQVIQAGYLIGERVLRPAMVAITKAPPKSEAPSANDNATADPSA